VLNQVPYHKDIPYLIKHHAMKIYGEVEVQLHIFLTLALDGGEWLASCPVHFTTRESTPGVHWIGGWGGSRVSLDMVEKRRNPLIAPAGNQTLVP